MFRKMFFRDDYLYIWVFKTTVLSVAAAAEQHRRDPVLAAAGAHDAQVARRGEASALAAHLAARGMQTRSTDTHN